MNVRPFVKTKNGSRVLFLVFVAAPLFVFYFLFVSLHAASAESQLGASLYIAPPAENPSVNTNFTLAIKVDSLEQPINAVTGELTFSKDRLEVVSISKIGSIFNLWVEEPQFSNQKGLIRFQGGVPRPGFIGNGGTVLLVIFRSKLGGVGNLVWTKGEVLAADGKGTNILSNLQNLTFSVEEDPGRQPQSIFNMLSIVLLAVLVLVAFGMFNRFMLRWHDLQYHRRPVSERSITGGHEPPPDPYLPEDSPPSKEQVKAEERLNILTEILKRREGQDGGQQ